LASTMYSVSLPPKAISSIWSGLGVPPIGHKLGSTGGIRVAVPVSTGAAVPEGVGVWAGAVAVVFAGVPESVGVAVLVEVWI
jgi:hypothetical protein